MITPASITPWIDLARLTIELVKELAALAPEARAEAHGAALAALRGTAAGKAAAASYEGTMKIVRDLREGGGVPDTRPAFGGAEPVTPKRGALETSCRSCGWFNAFVSKCHAPGGPSYGPNGCSTYSAQRRGAPLPSVAEPLKCVTCGHRNRYGRCMCEDSLCHLAPVSDKMTDCGHHTGRAKS